MLNDSQRSFGGVSWLPPETIPALSGGLKLLLTDRAAAATIVMRAREFARRAYDEKRLIKDIEPLYLNALERS